MGRMDADRDGGRHPQNNEDGTETVKIRAAIPVSNDTPRFLRLRVETE